MQKENTCSGSGSEGVPWPRTTSCLTEHLRPHCSGTEPPLEKHGPGTFYRPWEPLLLFLQSRRRGKQQNNSAASPRGQGMLHLEFNTPTRESWDLEQGSGDYCRQPRSVGQPKKAKLMVRSCKNQEPKEKPGK